MGEKSVVWGDNRSVSKGERGNGRWGREWVGEGGGGSG